MKPILLVSYHFPPTLAARGLQVFKLVKYASRLGLSFDVITAPLNNPHQTDDSLKYIEQLSCVRVHRSNVFGRNLLDHASSLLRRLPMFRWYRDATGKTLDLIEKNGPQSYSCMMTCALPVGSHMVGLAVKEKYPTLPWIAHFSDPWASNPLADPVGFWQRPLQRRIERRIIENADRIVYVGQQLLEFAMRDYPSAASKARVLHHVYDPESYGGPGPSPDNILTLQYSGGLSKERNADPLLEVVRHLKHRHATALPNLRFELVGGETLQAVKAINEIVPGLARTTGKVSYPESLRLMKQADMLFLIDANLPDSPFFPSKLADYFGSERPVLAISPSHSCSTALLQRENMPCFDYAHLQDMAKYLADLAEGKLTMPMAVAEIRRQYCGPTIAQDFRALLEETCSKP